jgi:hypothetical protein
MKPPIRRAWVVEQYLPNFGWCPCGGSILFTRADARFRKKQLAMAIKRKMRVVSYEPSNAIMQLRA